MSYLTRGQDGPTTTSISGKPGRRFSCHGNSSKWNYGEKPWRFFVTARMRSPSGSSSQRMRPGKDPPLTYLLANDTQTNLAGYSSSSDDTADLHHAPQPQARAKQGAGTRHQGTAMLITRGRDAAGHVATTTHVTSATMITGPCTVPNDLQLDVTRSKGSPGELPTPVNENKLARYLQGYDEVLSTFIIHGFREGFIIPFEGNLIVTSPTNLRSALQQPDIVEAKLQTELEAGRIAGPFTSPPFTNLFLSPIGLVPKKTPGKFRLIHHLSFPHGTSINDGISKVHTSVQYHTVDDAIDIINSLGPNAFLAKTDIQNAFRMVPVHPSSYHLLGFQWNGAYFYDMTLAMGLSASCQIFEKISTSMQWVAQNKLGIGNILHILDDFLILADTQARCERHLTVFSDWCAEVGIPLAPEKTEGPHSTITFAGIELDAPRMEARLPPEKVHKYRTMISDNKHKRKITLVELQRIIGALQHCCYIVPAGRAFLRRLIHLTKGLTQPFHHTRLNAEARADLETWDTFLTQFNGKAFFLDPKCLTSHTLHLYTDAAQSLGFGAVLQEQWFYGAWPDEWKLFDITFLELFPIVLALHLWGHLLANKRIVFHTDNMALVFILNKFSSKDPTVMKLVRPLALVCLKDNIMFTAEHIPGTENILADTLSRLNLQKFHLVAPHMCPHPVQIPSHLRPSGWRL